MLDALLDALWDTARLLPFLYLTYLAMELLEHRWKERTGALLQRAGRLGPLLGGLLGVVPQCGFSAAAAGLYAGRVLSLGTLLSVFLSTSDEMLPLLLSNRTPADEIFKILGLKALTGVVTGIFIDALRRRPVGTGAIRELCAEENCGCGRRGLFAAALRHTVEIGFFLLLVNAALNLLLAWLGPDALRAALTTRPALSVLLSALVGLIPNCAASVAITTLYLDGLLGFGAMMAGLLAGAGAGLLVLFRVNRDWRENLRLTLLLYVLGAAFGGLFALLVN